MDSTSMKYQEDKKPSLPSPNSQPQNNVQQIPSPRSITRSEPGNPYPTTFVQADTTSFKQVVQMLTGSSETSKQHYNNLNNNNNNNNNLNNNNNNIPKKQSSSSSFSCSRPSSGFKLYERRNSLHKNLNINPLLPPMNNNYSCFSSPRSSNKQEILSPSILDFPSLVLSPVTPLIPDPFDRSRNVDVDAEAAEDKAIREKGFFLHPSPVSTPRRDYEPPRLLPLFPTTSPKASSSSSSPPSNSSS